LLNLFGFGRIGVVIGDLYFVDPDPIPGQETPEQGVRIEVRLLELGTAEGSIYASRPIEVGLPIWRVDLLEDVANIGSFDRVHHHPDISGWEPGEREFVAALSAAPFDWVSERLAAIPELAARAGFDAETLDPRDVTELRATIPEIIAATETMVARVRKGELARAPREGDLSSVREGWL
jgi:hypothetical protein